jgi:hypothetical protein
MTKTAIHKPFRIFGLRVVNHFTWESNGHRNMLTKAHSH